MCVCEVMQCDGSVWRRVCVSSNESCKNVQRPGEEIPALRSLGAKMQQQQRKGRGGRGRE